MPVVEALREHKDSIHRLKSTDGVTLVPSYERNIERKTSYIRQKYGEFAHAQMHNLSGEGHGNGNMPIWASFANYNEATPFIQISPIDRRFFTIVKSLMQEHTGSQQLMTRDRSRVETFDFRNAIIESARRIGHDEPASDDSLIRPQTGPSIVRGLKINRGHDGRYKFQQQLIDLILCPEEERPENYQERLDHLAGRTFLHMKTLIAQERAAVKLRKEVGQIADYIETKKDKIGHTPEGLFTLASKEQREPNPIPLEDIDIEPYTLGRNINFADLSFPLPEDPRTLSAEQQAELVTNYLTQLTRRHTPDADLSDGFIRTNKDKIALQLRDGLPLQFSVYISLSKFTNPFNTRNSDPDIGELQRGIELAAFITNIASLTGKKPAITIMNEFPIFEPYTHSDGRVYQSTFEDILDGLGIAEQVHIKPFGLQTFIDFLAGRDIPEVSARTFTSQTLQLITQIYYAIGKDQIPLEQLEDHLKWALKNINTYPVPYGEYLDTFIEHCKRNYPDICAEYSQAIRSEFKGNTDLSLLYPEMSQSLLNAVLEGNGALGTNHAEDPSVVRNMRSQMTEHAKLQSINFKAHMRMRYLFKELFGEPIIDERYIPLSITNAKDKWSVSLGRTIDTNISIGNDQQKGVNPQNGIGVIVNNQIVSIPYLKVIENLDVFEPITIQVGNVVLNGYRYCCPTFLEKDAA